MARILIYDMDNDSMVKACQLLGTSDARILDLKWHTQGQSGTKDFPLHGIGPDGYLFDERHFSIKCTTEEALVIQSWPEFIWFKMAVCNDDFSPLWLADDFQKAWH